MNYLTTIFLTFVWFFFSALRTQSFAEVPKEESLVCNQQNHHGDLRGASVGRLTDLRGASLGRLGDLRGASLGRLTDLRGASLGRLMDPDTRGRLGDLRGASVGRLTDLRGASLGRLMDPTDAHLWRKEKNYDEEVGELESERCEFEKSGFEM